MEPTTPMIDMKEAIELLNTSQPTFYRWLREGRIPGHKVGRQWRFNRPDIEAIARGEQPSTVVPPDTQELNDALAQQLSDIQQTVMIEEDSSPVLEAMLRLLLLARASGATSLHLEADAQGGRARMRLDGFLREVARYTTELHRQLIATIKGQCHCAIDITDLPQDGRWKTANLGDEALDLRITTLPSVFGEDTVIRFSGQWSIPTLDEMGLPERHRSLIREALGESCGVNLTTGPTGSGKTTLLYAMLADCTGPTSKTIAIGENIVPSLAHAQYVPLRSQHMPALHAVRAASRMDADNILLEEIASVDIARELLACANLGCRVFTQMNASSPAEALVRLREMGLPPHQIQDTVRVVLGQRLLRQLAPECAVEDAPESARIEALAQRAGLPRDLLSGARWKQPAAEGERDEGFRGRVAAVQVLPFRGRTREVFAQGGDADELEAAASQMGYHSLLGEALLLAAAGKTSLAEVERVFRS